MPNHVINHLIASQTILDAISHKKDLIDFNTVIRMPEELRDVTAVGDATTLADLISGNTSLQTVSEDWLGRMSLSSAKLILERGGIKTFTEETGFENFIKILRNHRRHGYGTWYEWAIEKWGTKWNAYDQEKITGGIKFETAWSVPHPVIEALSKKFPNEHMDHSWSDEDIGSNLGHRSYDRGGFTDLSSGIEDPIDFALNMRDPERREEYRKNTDTGLWEYNEESE